MIEILKETLKDYQRFYKEIKRKRNTNSITEYMIKHEAHLGICWYLEYNKRKYLYPEIGSLIKEVLGLKTYNYTPFKYPLDEPKDIVLSLFEQRIDFLTKCIKDLENE